MITTGEAAVDSAMAPVGEAAGAGVGDADKTAGAGVGEDPYADPQAARTIAAIRINAVVRNDFPNIILSFANQ
jgi:hypothetical protein